MEYKNKISDFRSRLKHLVAQEKSERSFAKSIGMEQGTLRGILLGGAQGPSMVKLLELEEALGEEKFYWLLTGKRLQIRNVKEQAEYNKHHEIDSVLEGFREWTIEESKSDPDIHKLIEYYLDQVKRVVKETKKIE